MAKKRRKPTRPTERAGTSQTRHVRALQQAITDRGHLTPIGLRRIIASMPELRDLIVAAGELVVLADPGASREITPIGRSRGSSNGVVVLGDRATLRDGVSTVAARDRVVVARRKVRTVARAVGELAGARGDDVMPDPPRCQNGDCELVDQPQGYAVEVCRGCGTPIG